MVQMQTSRGAGLARRLDPKSQSRLGGVRLEFGTRVVNHLPFQQGDAQAARQLQRQWALGLAWPVLQRRQALAGLGPAVEPCPGAVRQGEFGVFDDHAVVTAF